jgi:hypothetical protein
MGDIDQSLGDVAVVAFPRPLCASLLILSTSSCCMCISARFARCASSYVMMILVIKLTRKFPNKLAIQKPYMFR